MKKIWKFLSSMGFAVGLLVILAAACALSSLVEQGLSREAYTARYGEGMANLILALGADDAYHSIWFIALSGFLCLNLLLCSVTRFTSFLRRWRQEKNPAEVNRSGELGDLKTSRPEQVFAAMGLKPEKCTDETGREALYASGNRAGVWGAWVCHAGVLLLIAGFALGQLTLRETVIWGAEGDTRSLADTGLEIRIDAFRTETREDHSILQYVTEITVTDPASGESRQASVRVNSPAEAGGYRLYQNNTGPAVRVTVRRGGEEIQRGTLLPQQSMAESVMGLADQPEAALYFAGIRTMREEGLEDRNVYFYDLYRNGRLEESWYFLGEGRVTVGEDEITFTPVPFTLLVARQDRFALLALAGGLVTLAGLAMAFLLQPKALWAVREEDGSWTVRGRCRKGLALMKERAEEAVRAAETEGNGHAER